MHCDAMEKKKIYKNISEYRLRGYLIWIDWLLYPISAICIVEIIHLLNYSYGILHKRFSDAHKIPTESFSTKRKMNGERKKEKKNEVIAG